MVQSTCLGRQPLTLHPSPVALVLPAPTLQDAARTGCVVPLSECEGMHVQGLVRLVQQKTTLASTLFLISARAATGQQCGPRAAMANHSVADAKVVMRDGVEIDALVYTPSGTPTAGVVFAHGGCFTWGDHTSGAAMSSVSPARRTAGALCPWSGTSSQVGTVRKGRRTAP